MIIKHPAVVAPVAGFLLGFLDFVWIKFLPYPLADLGNSMAVWAVAAFVLTYVMRWSWAASLAGAVAALVVAVPSYYFAAALIQHDDWSNMWAAYALLWMGFGIVGGLVFGAGGVVARTPGRLQAVALSLPGAVMVAEGLLQAQRIGDPSYDTAVVDTTVRFVIAVLLPLLLARTWRLRAFALLWSVPVGLLGFLAFGLTGFL